MLNLQLAAQLRNFVLSRIQGNNGLFVMCTLLKRFIWRRLRCSQRLNGTTQFEIDCLSPKLGFVVGL